MSKFITGHVTKMWFLKLQITSFWTQILHLNFGKCWKYDVVTFTAHLSVTIKRLTRYQEKVVLATMLEVKSIPSRVCKFYRWVESVWLLLHKFWSHGIFGVKHDLVSDFPARGPGTYTLSWRIHELAVAVCWHGKLKSMMAVVE